MFINPHISGQLVKERQQDMLASAEQHRLARQPRTPPLKSRHTATPGRRVHAWLMSAAARLRPAAHA